MAKTAKRNFDRGNGIVVATIVLCFMLTLGTCYFLAGEGVLTSAFAKDEARLFYALCQGGYDNVTMARSNADLIKLRGGAGYVITGESCEIILAVYPDKQSADSVVEKTKDKGVYIKEIAINATSMKWADKEEKELATKALTYFDTAFNTLYTQSNKLANGSITVEDIKTQMRVLSSQIEDIKSEFYSKTANNENNEITEIKLALVTCIALIDNVNTTSTLATALSSMRYQTVQLVMCYSALTNII